MGEQRGDDETGRDDAALHAALLSERTSAQERLAGLRAAIDEVVAARADANVDDEHDPEGATIAFERAQLQALADQVARRVAEVDEAMGRLARGDYGRCERCGRPVPTQRLVARPTARTCVGCA